MNTSDVLFVACSLLGGAVMGLILGVRLAGGSRKRRSTAKSKGREAETAKGAKSSIIRSVTRLLFVTTQMFALGWVSISYFIAIYATVCLSQPFPVVELSQQAIITILGVNALKVVENIFEHNNSVVFGQSNQEPAASDDYTGGEG